MSDIKEQHFAITLPTLVQCAECGHNLKISQANGLIPCLTVQVEPCRRCLDVEYDDGLRDGREKP